MSYKNQTRGLLACALIGFSPFSLAEESQGLEHVIVSGTRSEQPSVEIPASIQILTAEQIKLSGANNLVQVLNAQPGTQINDSIGNQSRGASISMRGFGSNSTNNVLVMVDGRKLNNPSLAGPDLASIAIKDIERVEIIQGSAGTLYGDQATGGVINVITKKAAELSGFLEAALGSDDYEAYQGAISQALDNGVSYRLSGEKSEGDNYRDNNKADYSNLLANVSYENKLFSFFAEGQTVDDDLRLPGDLSEAAIRDDRKQTFTPDDFSDRDTDIYRLGGSVNIGESWKLLAEYSTRDEDSKGSLFGGNFNSSTDVDTFEPRMAGQIDTANGPVLITAGIDLEEADYKYSSFSSTDVSQEAEDYYAQVISPITDKIKLTLGARYSDFEAKDNISRDKFEDDLTVYQAGIAYHFNDSSRIFFRRDESFRWANADENGFIPPTEDFLKPQEGTSWELGLETRINNVFLSALIYDMEIDNEILYDPSADGQFGPGSGANINLDESQRTGIVLNSDWAVTDSINIQLNYSYVDAQISSGFFDGNTVPFVAQSTANLILSYQLNKHWSFYTDAQYTGEMYAIGDEANDRSKLDDYTVINANVRWDYEGFYANLRMNNITGKEYNGFSGVFPGGDYNYPAPEETFQFALGYSF